MLTTYIIPEKRRTLRSLPLPTKLCYIKACRMLSFASIPLHKRKGMDEKILEQKDNFLQKAALVQGQTLMIECSTLFLSVETQSFLDPSSSFCKYQDAALITILLPCPGAGGTSSVGRARAQHARGLGFDSRVLHLCENFLSSFSAFLFKCHASSLCFFKDQVSSFLAAREHHWCSGNMNAFQAFASGSIPGWCILFVRRRSGQTKSYRIVAFVSYHLWQYCPPKMEQIELCPEEKSFRYRDSNPGILRERQVC